MAAGSGTATFTVEANPAGTARTGGVTVSGRVTSVRQNLTSLQPEGEDPSEPEIYEVQAVPLIEQGPGLAPSAASVSVGGRVTDSVGRAIGGVTVTLTDRDGESRIARTNPFGYYTFTEVLAGETYVFTLSAKRYRFSQSPIIRTIGDEATDVDFVADN